MNNILILASQSKRRAQILKSCGIKHKIIASRIKEKFHHHLHPKELVLHNAREKAGAVASRLKSGIVLGTDTLVLFKSQSVGKPKNAREARDLLKAFCGHKLFVYTGLCLIDIGGKRRAFNVTKTEIKAKNITSADLLRYLHLLGPHDKAGGFSIEGPGSIIFDDLKGSYFNVLGLPMNALADLFRKLGLNILDFMAR